MKRKEIAAAQKLELDQLAEREIADMHREALQARERIDAAAEALAERMGIALPQEKSVEPVAPLAIPADDRPEALEPAAEEAPVGEEHEPSGESKMPPREAANFADIAANIAGNDWKDL